MKEIEDKDRQKDIPLSSDRNQYCQNDCTTTSNSQIQCNPYAITNGNFSQNQKKKNLKNLNGDTKDQNRQSNSEKENGAGGMTLLDFRLYYIKLLHIKKKKKGTHYDIKT